MRWISAGTAISRGIKPELHLLKTRNAETIGLGIHCDYSDLESHLALERISNLIDSLLSASGKEHGARSASRANEGDLH